MYDNKMYDLIIDMVGPDGPYTNIKIQAPKTGAPAIQFTTNYSIEGLSRLCHPISKLLETIAFKSLSKNQKGANGLREIRDAGYSTLTKLLSYDKRAQPLVKSAWASASSVAPIKIIVRGRAGAGVPWELLMIDDPATCYNHLEKSHLIGDHAIISRHLEFESTHFPYDAAELKVVALSHQNLRYSSSEINNLHKRLSLRGARVHHVSKVITSNVQAGAKQICDEMLAFEPYQIAHFACHNTADMDPARVFIIEVRQSFPLCMDDLNSAQFNLASNCFVFLNCCSSGYEVGKHSNLVEYLLLRGGSTALATLCRISDKYAQDMSQAIYENILPLPAGTGINVGEAVLRARNDLWKKNRSLAGYVYALYGDPKLKL